MGEWTHIEGTVKAKNTSIRKIIETVLDGEDFVFDYGRDDFRGRFEHGGLEAAKTIDRIIKAVKERDSNARISIESEITFSA